MKSLIICVLGTIVAHVSAGHEDITPSLVPASILHSVPLGLSPSIHLTQHDDLVALPLTFDWSKWKHKDDSEYHWDRDGVRDGDRDRDRDMDRDKYRDKDKDRDWSWIVNEDWKLGGDKVGDGDRDGGRGSNGDRDKHKDHDRDRDWSWLGNRDWNRGGDRDGNGDRDSDRNKDKDNVRVWSWGDDKGHRDRDKGHKKFNLFKKFFKC